MDGNPHETERLCPLTREECWQDDKGPDGKGCMFWKEGLRANQFGAIEKVKMCALTMQPIIAASAPNGPGRAGGGILR